MKYAEDKQFDCVVCGSAVADILVRPFTLDSAIGPGTIRVVDPIEVATGGIVSNSGAAMARLGMRVAGMGNVGDDHWGTMFRRQLDREGIDTSRIDTDPTAPTTTAVVMIDAGGQRSFAYCPGATHRLNGPSFLRNLDLFARCHRMLLGYYSLLPNLENDLPEILQAIRETGCQTALDSAGEGGNLQPLDAALPYLDVYVPSYAEATHQTGCTDPESILEVYRECGAGGLLGVKLGSKGALLSPAPGEYVRIDPVSPPTRVVDTTGAGDAFYAGLLTGLQRALPLVDAGRLGAAAASCCITAKGATRGLRSYAETAELAGVCER